MKFVSTIIGCVFVVMLTGCSDTYRYPCQDPANFGSPQCVPPACEANGACTKYLIDQEEETNEE